MFRQVTNLAIALSMGVLAIAAPAYAGVAEIEAVLQSYADDYASDVTRFDGVFGIEVAGNWWTVSSTPDATTLTRGAPSEPTYYYTITEEETLHQIDRGELNMFTGMTKAFSTDVTPTDMDMLEGYQPGANFMTTVIPQVFHFWTRGIPEVVQFSEDRSLPTHGAHVVTMYYQEGFRSGWGYLAPGDHANEHELSQSNPFPSLFIGLQGRATARIGGQDSVFEAGSFMVIPPGVTHEFLNPYDENFQFILIMFGEGA